MWAGGLSKQFTVVRPEDPVGPVIVVDQLFGGFDSPANLSTLVAGNEEGNSNSPLIATSPRSQNAVVSANEEIPLIVDTDPLTE